MIGIVIPVLTNFHGLIDTVNTIRSKKHQLQYCILDNALVKRSVAASWNTGADFLFSQGATGVIIANDDILCTSFTIDTMITAQKESKVALLTATNIAGAVKDPLTVVTMPSWEEEGLHPSPDFSLFYLPKRTWDRIGRFDENFYPAYFEDNDYHARIVLSGERALRCLDAPFFHFGSRTQNMQADNAGNPVGVVSAKEFELCRSYFEAKWGCPPVNDEQGMSKAYYKTPFNDKLLSIRDTPQIR